MIENIYKYAIKESLRFPFKGYISAEDLYDLTAEELDTVYKTLNKQVKTSNEESLLDAKTKDDEALEVKIAIVKEVFTEKKEAAQAKILAAENKAKKQKLMQILADKQEAALMDLSEEELIKKISEL